MDVAEARRCVLACANYFRRKDESPRAAGDLEEAVKVLCAQAEETRTAAQAEATRQTELRRTAEHSRDCWKEPLIDALVVNCILRKEHELVPKLALNDLICWEVKLALDPAVSKKMFDELSMAYAAGFMEGVGFAPQTGTPSEKANWVERRFREFLRRRSEK